MFEALAIDQTPVIFNASQNFFQTPRTVNPVLERRKPVAGPTIGRVVQARAPTVEVFSTATVADLTGRLKARRASDEPNSVRKELSPLEKTQQDRVALLAKKYATHLDADASARLEILTQKMRVARPRVSMKAKERVRVLRQEVTDIADDIADLREKYGI